MSGSQRTLTPPTRSLECYCLGPLPAQGKMQVSRIQIYSQHSLRCQKNSPPSTSWVMMDIQSWWPGGNPRLTRDRPISLFSSQARTEIQSPSKNFDWQYSFATKNYCIGSTNWLPLSFAKDKSWKFAFLSIISTPCFVFGVLWGLRWGGIDQTENPLVSPTLPLLLLDYPSRIWIPRKSPLPSSGSLYPELTNEFLTLGLLLRWLLKIITLNRDLSGTLFRTDTLAKKVQHKIICL